MSGAFINRRENMSPSQIHKDVKIGTETLTISIEADSRLRRTVRWRLNGQTIHMRVPTGMSRKRIDEIINDILPRIQRQRKRAELQNDINLAERAEMINRQYFGGDLSWHSIRWSNSMKRRLGSCTTGGSTDGDIRISERIRNWPSYVVDYILAHEICHRKYANHSPEIWEYLGRYPFTQKALGFLDGIAYTQGSDPGDLLE